MERIIGSYTDHESGPLFICLGAMHGNEPAGVKAIQLVLKMLEVEHVRNPNFRYQGNFLGLIGNVKAYKAGVRFLSKDLNRLFTQDNLDNILEQRRFEQPEHEELYELVKYIKDQVYKLKPSLVILLDLHTTSSYGGIFTICRNDQEAIDIASTMHAPIVLGMLKGLQGTTLHYFVSENLGVKTIPITFESGQHNEALSVRRAVAGIINCMKAIGAVQEEDVENHHEEILIQYSKQLPQITELIKRYDITEADKFKMKPGYNNFQEVSEGEVVASSAHGPVVIPSDGLLLMPLYQEQGEEGYFLVKEIHDN